MLDMLKRRARHSKEETTETLINASFKLITKNGWDNFSIRKLAEACKMSPSNITYHFKNNETIMMALLDKISENNYKNLSRAIHEKMSALDLLTVYFEKNIEWAEKSPEEAQIILLIYSRAGYDKEFSKVCTAMIERAQSRIAEILQKGVNEGAFKLNQPIAIIATHLHQLILGACVYRVGLRSSEFVGRENFREYFKGLLNI